MKQSDSGTPTAPVLVATPASYRVPLLWFAGERDVHANLLFMPALGMQARWYVPLAQALAQRGWNVALFEQRGHGHSSLRAARRSDWGFRDWLDADVPAAVGWLHAQAPRLPTIVGGHSLGGHMGACFAALHPDRVDGLLLAATATPFAAHFPAATARQIRLLVALLPPLTALLGYYPGDRVGFGGREARGLMRDWRRMATHDDYRPAGIASDIEAALTTLDKPVLELTFADDPYAPATGAAAVTAKLRAARVTRVALDAAALGARADHFRWARHPERVAPAIDDWWRAAR